MSIKDWWVIEKDGKYYAVEDKHNGIKPKMIGATLRGRCCFKEAVDAIDYITFVDANRPMRRSKGKD